MSPSVFCDRSHPPDERGLAEALGKTAALWLEIRDAVKNDWEPVVEEWKYYGAKCGWSLKTLHKKRNLFFFVPGAGSFMISFVFGDKAVAAIERSDLPRALIEEVRSAKKYAEGRGLRITVGSRRDVGHVRKLIAIKMTN